MRPGPSSSPYSPKCVEGVFSEVGYPLDFVTLVVTFERR